MALPDAIIRHEELTSTSDPQTVSVPSSAEFLPGVELEDNGSGPTLYVYHRDKEADSSSVSRTIRLFTEDTLISSPPAMQYLGHIQLPTSGRVILHVYVEL